MSEISEIRRDSEVILDLEIENQQLKARVAGLVKTLTNVKNCPESDLTQYCMSVDSMVCEALAKTPKQSLADIKAEAIREAVDSVLINKPNENEDYLSAYDLVEYADKLQAEGE